MLSHNDQHRRWVALGFLRGSEIHSGPKPGGGRKLVIQDLPVGEGGEGKVRFSVLHMHSVLPYLHVGAWQATTEAGQSTAVAFGSWKDARRAGSATAGSAGARAGEGVETKAESRARGGAG